MKTLSLVSFAALLTTGGLALAGDPKPAETKPAPKAPEKAADKAPAMPTPPAQIAELGKTVNGTWKCKGTVGETGKSMAMEATIKTSTDGFWITDVMEAKAGPMKFAMQSFTTFDAAAKKWRRVAVDSMGAHMVGTAEPMGKDGKVTFNLDTTGPTGASLFKDEVDASDAKKGVKMAGKMSTDKGKTWTAVYEMTCTK